MKFSQQWYRRADAANDVTTKTSYSVIAHWLEQSDENPVEVILKINNDVINRFKKFNQDEPLETVKIFTQFLIDLYQSIVDELQKEVDTRLSFRYYQKSFQTNNPDTKLAYILISHFLQSEQENVHLTIERLEDTVLAPLKRAQLIDPIERGADLILVYENCIKELESEQ